MAEEGDVKDATCIDAIAHAVTLVLTASMYRIGAKMAMNAVSTLTRSEMRARAEEISVIVKNMISAYISMVTELHDTLPDTISTCVSEGMDIKKVLSIIREYI